MFGKKSSFVSIKKYLRTKEEVKSIAEAEFYQGRTLRWALAWTFHSEDEFKFPQLPEPSNETKGVKHGDKSASMTLELSSTLYQDDQYNQAFVYNQAKECLTSQLQVSDQSSSDKLKNSSSPIVFRFQVQDAFRGGVEERS